MKAGYLYETPRDGRRGVKAARSFGPEAIPLFQAVADGKIAMLVWGDHAKPLPLDRLAKVKVPVLVWFMEHTSKVTGPDAWVGADEAMKWAGRRFHAYSQNMAVEFYSLVVDGVLELGHYLLVATLPETVNAWQRAAGVETVRLREVGADAYSGDL